MTAITMSGCDSLFKRKLATPKDITIENGYIKIPRVQEDQYYELTINDYTINVFVKEAEDKKNEYLDLYSINGVNFLEYDANRLFSLGDSYSIKVKACAKGKKDSDYSSIISYTHTIKMETPTNVRISGTTLTWDSMANAGYYNVKVLTPLHSSMADDRESVRRSNLPAYQFSVNSFNFESLLNSAGKYKFYVSAVSRDNTYSESDLSEKVEYIHNVTLGSPRSSVVHKVDTENGSEIRLLSVLEPNTRSIQVKANDIESNIVDLNDNTIVTILGNTDNLISVNLSKLFENTSIDISKSEDYRFNIRAVFDETGTNFHKNSEYSSDIFFSNKNKLNTPDLHITHDEVSGKNIATWSTDEAVGGYTVYLISENDMATLVTKSEETSLVLDDTVKAVAVQSFGGANDIRSSLSEIKSVMSSGNTPSIDFSLQGSNVTWNEVQGAKYLVEIEDKVIFSNENSFNLLTLNSKAKSIRVTPIAENLSVKTFEASLDYSLQLPAPSVVGGGFVNPNPYLLSFRPVRNAIGYRIYVTAKGGERCPIPSIFTRTSVDISSYLITTGEYNQYDVEIQAIADPLGMYVDSTLTQKITVTHTRSLGVPQVVMSGSDPVSKEKVGGVDKYYFRFLPVTGAGSYEILVNFNQINVIHDSRDVYELDITRYLSDAGLYTIQYRAVPVPSEKYIVSSQFGVKTYSIIKQLPEVTEIRVTENQGEYTLTFKLIAGVTNYRVRVVKLNDSGYVDYLNEKGLNNIFTVTGAVDITQYVEQGGEYYIYVTALSSDSYHVDSDQSNTFGRVSKLETLPTPTFFTDKDSYENISSTKFVVNYNGSEHADYYIITVTNPDMKVKEFNTVTNITSFNINDFMTKEGNYHVTVKACVNSDSENAKNYSSSHTSQEYVINYQYELIHDFERAKVYYNGGTYSMNIANASQFTNVLWHGYLFGMDSNYGLDIHIVREQGESVHGAVVRIANELDTLNVYRFKSDTNWLDLVNNDTNTEDTLLKYIAEKVLLAYPEMAVLKYNGDDFVKSTEISTDDVKFKLNYYNALDFTENNRLVEKVRTPSHCVESADDFANKYKYLDTYYRRSANSQFEIDSKPEMSVATTEQLLMAVQYERKPTFDTDNTLAEIVYQNAKNVLRAINTNTDSELKKATNIFDWLSYAFNINPLAKYNVNGVSKEELSVAEYGLRAEFYLEGIFERLSTEPEREDGGFDGEFYLYNKATTDEAFAKAYVLLCGIEGIKTRKVNGEIDYMIGSDSHVYESHTWNKIYLDTQGNNTSRNWYNVDITFSDYRREYYNNGNISREFNFGSHTLFLVDDDYLSSGKLKFGAKDVFYTEKTSPVLHPNEVIGATSKYEYYLNSTFSLTREDIRNTLNDNKSGIAINNYIKDVVEYSLRFNDDVNYQKYFSTSNAGKIQTFLINILTMAKKNLSENYLHGLNHAKIEFEICNLSTGTLTGAESVSEMLDMFNTTYQQTASADGNKDPGPIKCDTYSSYNSETKSTIFVLMISFDV